MTVTRKMPSWKSDALSPHTLLLFVCVLVSSLNRALWLLHLPSLTNWIFSSGRYENTEPSNLPKLSSTFQLWLAFEMGPSSVQVLAVAM